ncbi:hypothetical protein KJ765_04040 [Candidatus Micrarchaeota archaeon]|nr:hypothetical protein [Candidatus Micrarchaeota archaeon]
MELFLVHKQRYPKLFSEEDDFYYPLVLNTRLLYSRYIGKPISVKLVLFDQPLEGLFLGVIDHSLYSYFQRHIPKSALAVTTLSFGEGAADWLALNTRSPRVFEGVKHLSDPKVPPYFVMLTDLGHFILFTAFSEQEQLDLPKINYNLVITNEAIDQLTRFLKRHLPRSQKKTRSSHKTAIKPAGKSKGQLHIKPFFGKQLAQEK